MIHRDPQVGQICSTGAMSLIKVAVFFPDGVTKHDGTQRAYRIITDLQQRGISNGGLGKF